MRVRNGKGEVKKSMSIINTCDTWDQLTIIIIDWLLLVLHYNLQQMRQSGIGRIPTSGLSHTHRPTELLKSWGFTKIKTYHFNEVQVRRKAKPSQSKVVEWENHETGSHCIRYMCAMHWVAFLRMQFNRCSYR